MKSPARSRRHKTVEPIDFRELLDAPALNGLKEALAHRREPEDDIPHFPAPPANSLIEDETNAVELTAVETTAATSQQFQPASRIANGTDITAVESDALDVEAFALGLLDESALGRRTGRRTFNVQPAARIETIFSPSELRVLKWMWTRGRAVDGVSMARLVTASNGEGMRRLAVHFGVAYTTFRNLVRSLSTKLAVEIVKQETTHPAIYLIYHYSAILERLRQAGLTGVIHKGSNAWVLIDADSQPAPAQPELTLQELKRKLIALKAHAVHTTALASSETRQNATNSNALNTLKNQRGAVESGALLNHPSGVNSAAPIRSKEYPSGSQFPSPPTLKSHAPEDVIDALFERTQRTDADAARSITSSCTAANPTVTNDEIARLIREFQIPPTISNPVGLLIRTLSTRCEPESLERYRRHWEAEDLQAARFKAEQQQENERIARMVLEDPETTESEREWAPKSPG